MIVGYQFRGQRYTPDDIVREYALATQTSLDGLAVDNSGNAFNIEWALDVLADEVDIDRTEPDSFDEADFPKAVREQDTTALEVLVLHNESDGRFEDYEPGNELLNVFGFSFPADTDLLALCERVYAITNSYPEELFGAAVDFIDLVAAYRAAKLRSLSIGDVLVVDGRAFAVASAGFTELAEVPDWEVQQAARNDIKVALARWDARSIKKYEFYGIVEGHLTAGLVSVRTVANITGIDPAVIDDRVEYLRHLRDGDPITEQD